MQKKKKKNAKYVKFVDFLHVLNQVIALFITGNYVQRPNELSSENRLFLSCLVFEVKQFEAWKLLVFRTAIFRWQSFRP